MLLALAEAGHIGVLLAPSLTALDQVYPVVVAEADQARPAAVAGALTSERVPLTQLLASLSPVVAGTDGRMPLRSLAALVARPLNNPQAFRQDQEIRS